MRRSYKSEIKILIKLVNFCLSFKKYKQITNARRRLKTIAAKLFSEVKRKLPMDILEKNKERFKIFDRVLTQQKKDFFKKQKLQFA